MFISSYTFGVSLGQVVEVFEAPKSMSLKKLLDRQGLDKGSGGAAFQLGSSLVRGGNDRYPSDLLLRRSESGELQVVGAISIRYAECKDFSIIASESDLIEKAKQFATHIQTVDPDDLESIKSYQVRAVHRATR